MSPLSSRLLAGFVVSVPLVTGCGSLGSTYPSGHALLPTGTVQITEHLNVPITSLIGYTGALTIAYLVIDPLAPNWEVKETRLAANEYQLSLRMKNFHTGGDGEARQVFQRRAAKLARDGGYGGYQIVSYTEGIDSTTVPSAQQVSDGVIQLVAKGLD
ncbi:MAG: hypothetical protein PHU46_16800 [Rhodocyclaceae bacterium]|nr:hypothetical protein [Rhodocyclaceae bacterium]